MQSSLTWQLSSKFIQFAYQDCGLNQGQPEMVAEHNINASQKQNLNQHANDLQEQESYEISRQAIDFQEKSQNLEMLEIITESKLLLDEATGTCVFTSKEYLPKINISLVGQKKIQGENHGISQKKYVELLLSEKSQQTEHDKYRVNKKGMLGKTRAVINKQNPASFDKIKFNYASDRPIRLIVVLYQVLPDKTRNYKTAMISNEIMVLGSNKVVSIDTLENIKPYFQQDSTHKLPFEQGYKSLFPAKKINDQNKKARIAEEIHYFENSFLYSKKKKNSNLFYILSKYSDILDLYILSGNEQKNCLIRAEQLWKQVQSDIKGEKIVESERTCNYIHPQAKFVLKIGAPLPTIKIIIRKQLTKLLSIIASDCQFKTCDGKWIKFQYSHQQASHKQKPMEVPNSKTSAVGSQAVDQMKKPITHKEEDEQFNQEQSQEDDDGQYQGDSSENYSMSNPKKRGRRIGQKKNNISDYKKIPQAKQNKYATRNRTKARDQLEDSHDKKSAIQRKQREKQLNSRQNSNVQQQSNLPFKILTPAQTNDYNKNQMNAQGNKMGMMNMGNMMIPVPMNQMNQMMGMKKPDDKSPQGINLPKNGMPMPVMMPMGGGQNPQQAFQTMMQGNGRQPNFPPGAQVISLGNGMQAVMLPVSSMDKMYQQQQQGSSSSGMPTQMMGSMPMMFGGMNSGSGNGQSNMPQGFIMQMPGMMGEKNSMMNNLGNKQQEDKSKSQQDIGKKQEKKTETFPPSGGIDLSKMSFMGQMPTMAGSMNSNGNMQMPQGMMAQGMGGQPSMQQMMQMGMMPGMFSGMQGMNPGMGQGIAMPMQGTKPGDQKQQNKQNTGMGNFPMFMVPGNQMGNSGNEGQSNMPMGFMTPSNYMQNMQSSNSQHTQTPQSQHQQQHQQGIMMNMMSPEAMQMMRNMSPQQQQQMFMQMKGMMPGGMFQMPKNDGSDQNKK